MKKLSIIIPVYNEEKTIIDVLKSVENVKIDYAKEVIIIDDGSIDNTLNAVNEHIKKKKEKKNLKLIFISKNNEGKGSAIREGIRAATGDLVIIQDADLEYDTKDIPRLIEYREKEKCDVVYGSRILQKNPYVYITYYLGNVFLSYLTRILYSVPITDMETCYKLVPLHILKELKLTSSGFDIEPEITAKIIRRGYIIKETPISYRPRSKAEGKKIRWRDGLDALFLLIYWRFKKI